jgi:L,D-transpeptidase YnhG
MMKVARVYPRSWAVCAALAAAALLPAGGLAAGRKHPPAPAKAAAEPDGRAEARLIGIYRMVGKANSHRVLEKAQALVSDYPNFQLGQLIYGDLLMAHVRPPRLLGDVPAGLGGDSPRLRELRDESRLRLLALQERPPADAVPAQFVSLSPRNKHAIAVDVSKARLYLLENTPQGPRLIADYYISVGKAGVGKNVEGDQRTPLGLYFITSNLNPKSLKDLYGSGALPINYPNALDVRRGKGGSGIWLHGTPSSQFSRAPLATDGCVAVANPDLERIIRTVEIRTTPVVIAKSLKWVGAKAIEPEKTELEGLLKSWADAKTRNDAGRLMGFYAADFTADEKTLAVHAALKQGKPSGAKARETRLSDISLLRWTDEADVLVSTFGELATGEKNGRTIRQYWERRKGQWKIVYEGVVG